MRTRACIQSFDNGDVQGFLYIDDDTGESLVLTTERYKASSPNTKEFTMNGSKGTVSVFVRVNVTNQSADFDVDFVEGGVSTSSQFTRKLAVNPNPC